MANIFDLFPSRYYRGEHLTTEGVLLTVKVVKVEPIAAGPDQEQLPVVYFNEDPRGWVLNKTGVRQLAAAWGRETDEWSGREVTLYQSRTTFGGDEVACVRAKVKEN